MVSAIVANREMIPIIFEVFGVDITTLQYFSWEYAVGNEGVMTVDRNENKMAQNEAEKKTISLLNSLGCYEDSIRSVQLELKPDEVPLLTLTKYVIEKNLIGYGDCLIAKKRKGGEE